MVDVAAGLVFRAGGDQQHSDRWHNHGNRQVVLDGQAAAHPHRPRALKQEALAVVEQLPGQPEQGSCGFLGGVLFLLLTGSTHQGGIHGHGEATACSLADPSPTLQHLCRVLQRQGRVMEGLAPGDQVRLHLAGPIGKNRIGPDGPALQIPAQLLRLNRPQRGDQAPPVTLHPDLAAGIFVDQLGVGRWAAHTVLLMEVRVTELEHQLLHRLRPRLGHRWPIRGQTPSKGNEDVMYGCCGPAGAAAHWDMGRFFIEISRQRSGFCAIKRQQDHGKGVPPTLGLHLEPMLQLVYHPIRLEGCGTHQHHQPRGGLDRGSHLAPKRIAPLQLAGIDPNLKPEIRQGFPQLPHKAIIGRAVGEKEVGQQPVIRLGSG